jgi:hypothetical protein
VYVNLRPLAFADDVKQHCHWWQKPAIFSAMSITAIVEDGKTVIPKDIHWPSGTLVRIEPMKEQPPTLWETLKDFDGMAGDLPSDLADNLDHYVHGHSR